MFNTSNTSAAPSAHGYFIYSLKRYRIKDLVSVSIYQYESGNEVVNTSAEGVFVHVLVPLNMHLSGYYT